MKTLSTLRTDLTEIQRALEVEGHEWNNAQVMMRDLEDAQRDIEDALLTIKYRKSYIRRWMDECRNDNEEKSE